MRLVTLNAYLQRCISPRFLIFDTKFSGSLNVLECIKKNKRIKTGIIITTDKVYDITNNKIFKETDKLGGLDPYSSSKVCVEFLFNSYFRCTFFYRARFESLGAPRASLTGPVVSDGTGDMLGQVLGHQAPPTRPLDAPGGLTIRMFDLRVDEKPTKTIDFH